MQAEISMALMIVIILIADLVMKAPHNKTLQTIACTLMVIQLIMNIELSAGEFFGGMYHCTPVASVVKTILTAGTLLVFLQAGEWISAPDTRHKAGEFYVITLSTLLGMYFMVSAGSFIMFYVGLELASIPMACLIAFDKWKHHSAEAGAKFILNSMFSSGLMLYGLSLIYGTCGTTYFADMTASITGTPLQILAMVFFFAGLGFKLSLVPFHMWTPDTYQGAPTAVAGYLSVISKGAAAFALMSILTKVFAPMADRWALMLSIVIVLTITVANIFAILQDNMKRFMAYSSISQAGYIMLAVMAGNTQGTTSLIYYITVYIVANLAVFGVIGAVERHALRTTVDADMAEGELPENTLSRSEETAASERAVSRSAYAGLYRTNPRLTFVMTLAMFSLAGIPPFAGFFSKFFVFASAFNTGHWLVVFLALVNTVISLYYYLLVVKAMYITPNDNPLPYFRSSWLTRISLAVCLAGIILLGIISSVYGGIETVAGM
ncbi:MAG: NADH-quinone oxidoreductase subunit N [Candidatus Phocaeicola faecipullorum]|nr:NADH-quinone oxidoreductase subunit N [Candidatus Phocaeicola faecipullorum]